MDIDAQIIRACVDFYNEFHTLWLRSPTLRVTAQTLTPVIKRIEHLKETKSGHHQ